MRVRLAFALAVLGLGCAPALAQDEGDDPFFAPLRQEALLRAAAAQLEPHRPGVVDLYAIAVAGSATEEVFRREAESAKALFEDRFDAKGRAVLLANSPTTARAAPLATTDNLRRAIEEAAARMNPEEDVLLLFLTSHGERGRFALRYPGLPPEDLRPEALDRMLDEAGVKWRVVIISACHSGSFIPALRDPWTLALTAAAADRASFGCGDEFHFTYFGKALMDEELRRTHSFIDAFKAARETIAAREAAEGFTPSLPQAYVGDEIRGKLDRLEKRLAAGAPGG